MDHRERINVHDNVEHLMAAMDGRQTRIWTALPGIIKSFNPAAMTCEVNPSVKARLITLAKGNREVATYVALPPCLDCPVVFPSGGGSTLTFPIQPGDECLIVFASRGIDYWWQQGGVQPPAECRMHDLSDGFVIPGPFSQPRVPASFTTSGPELRAPAAASINAPSVQFGGNAGIDSGWTGTFATGTGQVVTVTAGIITSVV